jgi:hypothetical protein
MRERERETDLGCVCSAHGVGGADGDEQGAGGSWSDHVQTAVTGV